MFSQLQASVGDRVVVFGLLQTFPNLQQITSMSSQNPMQKPQEEGGFPAHLGSLPLQALPVVIGRPRLTVRIILLGVLLQNRRIHYVPPEIQTKVLMCE